MRHTKPMTSQFSGMLSVLLMFGGGVYAAPSATEGIEPDISLTCYADPPTVFENEGTTLRVLVSGLDGELLAEVPSLVWAADVGSFKGPAVAPQWDLYSAQVASRTASKVTATVTAVRAGHADVRCLVDVYISKEISRGSALSLVSAKRHLLPGESEAPGFGLYSYLLLSAPPRNDDVRQRYLKTIEAFLSVLQDVDDYLVRQVPPAGLNATYIPLKAMPAAAGANRAMAENVLDAYDYATAALLLRRVDLDARDGPYLISALAPLSKSTAGARLHEDLTGVAPDLAWDWIRHFTFLAAQERSWSDAALQRLALNVRNVIAVGGKVTPQVMEGLGKIIQFRPK